MDKDTELFRMADDFCKFFKAIILALTFPEESIDNH